MNSIDRSPGERAITLEHVRVVRSGRTVLDDVGFSLARGELTGLIGANGAGKTTIFRVMLGLQPIASGRVERAGGSSTTIGYVPQKFAFDPDLPVRASDLVALGVDGSRFGFPLPSAARRRRVADALEAVGASAFGDARLGALSGGEQQRVLIAHALAGQPAVLLLDEPLANLDLRSEQEIVALLGRLAREAGLAVLISAHEMNPLLPVMDRVVYVAGGRVASGTTAEVVRPEVLTALYGHHVDVLSVHGRVLVVAAPDVALDARHDAGDARFHVEGRP